MFSREYCKIFKDTYFPEHLRTAASEVYKIEIPLLKENTSDSPDSINKNVLFPNSLWLIQHNPWILQI